MDTTATFLEAGVYVLSLTADDGDLTTSDDVAVTVNQAAQTNQTPVVDAGPNMTIDLSTAAILDGAVSDDGLPSGQLSVHWSKSSGPGSVSFANAGAVDTTATFSVAGSYVLRLTADDGDLAASHDVTITVVAPSPGSTIQLNPNTVPDYCWLGGDCRNRVQHLSQ